MSDSAISIALVISTMGPGGAERVVSHLSRHWVTEGKQVVVITLSKEIPFYELEQGVDLVGLDLMSRSNSSVQGAVNNLRRIRALRKVFRNSKPDVIISFMDKTNVIVLAAAWGLGIPVIVSERLFPGSYKLGFPWEILRKLSYASAFSVVAVTEAMKLELQRLGFSRIRVIHNPVVLQQNSNGVQRLTNRKVILAAGRFDRQKGFDVLIEAFSIVQKQFPEWKLIIVGSGELDLELKQITRQTGVEEKVQFPGTRKNLAEYIENADIFVLSSRNEGFPNVLLEAMAAGTAVISSNCQSGPSEMIVHNESGLLVAAGDVSSLSRALERVMADDSLRFRLGQNARKVQQQFSVTKVMNEWQRLLNEATAA